MHKTIKDKNELEQIVVAVQHKIEADTETPTIHTVRTLESFLPNEQDDKLDIIAEISDLPIYIDVDNDKGAYTPLPSRLAHMTVLDILAVGISASKAGLREHLDSIEQGLQSLRLEGPE